MFNEDYGTETMTVFMDEVAKKAVRDFDGFWTEYTMYARKDWETKEVLSYIFILGDSDLFDEENYDPDWEADSYEEALEWWRTIDEDYFSDGL